MGRIRLKRRVLVALVGLVALSSASVMAACGAFSGTNIDPGPDDATTPADAAESGAQRAEGGATVDAPDGASFVQGGCTFDAGGPVIFCDDFDHDASPAWEGIVNGDSGSIAMVSNARSTSPPNAWLSDTQDVTVDVYRFSRRLVAQNVRIEANVDFEDLQKADPMAAPEEYASAVMVELFDASGQSLGSISLRYVEVTGNLALYAGSGPDGGSVMRLAVEKQWFHASISLTFDSGGTTASARADTSATATPVTLPGAASTMQFGFGVRLGKKHTYQVYVDDVSVVPTK